LRLTRSALLAELARRIEAVRREHPVRVAIDGIDAAGKTTLADELVEPLQRLGRPVIRASIDRFHNCARVRHRRGRESPEGYYLDSFDHAGLVSALLAPLGPGGSRLYRSGIFDHRTDSPVREPAQRAAADAILLFDGVFLLRRELRRYWDFSVFLDADFSVAVARAERRDVELFGSAAQVRKLYRRRYVPGQQLYLSESRPRAWASVVVENDDPLRPVLR
jgi:uridine kinase